MRASLLDLLASYRASLAGDVTPPMAYWLWNMSCSFRWGSPQDHMWSAKSLPLSRGNDDWTELGALSAFLARDGDIILGESSESIQAQQNLVAYWRSIGTPLPRIGFASCTDPAPAGSCALSPASPTLICFGNTEQEEAMARQNGWMMFGGDAGSAAICNDKRNVRRWCELRSIPTPPGQLCRSTRDAEVAAAALFRQFEQVVIKEPYAASGTGIVICNSVNRVTRALRDVPQDSTVIVEGWIKKQASHNSQYLIAVDGTIHYLGHTEQLLDRQKYIGSKIWRRWQKPFHEQEIALQIKVLEEAHGEGYHGVAGIDSFLGIDNAFVPAVELNARFNLSTYVLAFLELIGFDGEACFKNYHVSWPCNLSLNAFLYRLRDLPWFGQGRRFGILPLVFTGETSPASRRQMRLGMLFMAERRSDLAGICACFEKRFHEFHLEQSAL